MEIPTKELCMENVTIEDSDCYRQDAGYLLDTLDRCVEGSCLQ
jgi:hypothetical protein